MNLEGPPAIPEKKEKELITREACLEAMKANNFEIVREWYEQRQRETESMNDEARVDLTIDMAILQFEAGLFDYARDTILEGIAHGDVRANLTKKQEEVVKKLRNHLDI